MTYISLVLTIAILTVLFTTIEGSGKFKLNNFKFVGLQALEVLVKLILISVTLGLIVALNTEYKDLGIETLYIYELMLRVTIITVGVHTILELIINSIKIKCKKDGK